MRSLFAVFCAFVITTQAALCNPQGTSPLIIFRGGATRTNEVAYTKDSNIIAPDKAYEFVPVNGDRCAANYTHNGTALQYSPPPPPADTSPKPAQFIIACTSDGGIPVNMRQNLNLMALWLKQGERAVALTIWDLIKASATAPQKAAIQGHANANNITLPN